MKKYMLLVLLLTWCFNAHAASNTKVQHYIDCQMAGQNVVQALKAASQFQRAITVGTMTQKEAIQQTNRIKKLVNFDKYKPIAIKCYNEGMYD